MSGTYFSFIFLASTSKIHDEEGQQSDGDTKVNSNHDFAPHLNQSRVLQELYTCRDLCLLALRLQSNSRRFQKQLCCLTYTSKKTHHAIFPTTAESSSPTFATYYLSLSLHTSASMI